MYLFPSHGRKLIHIIVMMAEGRKVGRQGRMKMVLFPSDVQWYYRFRLSKRNGMGA